MQLQSCCNISGFVFQTMILREGSNSHIKAGKKGQKKTKDDIS